MFLKKERFCISPTIPVKLKLYNNFFLKKKLIKRIIKLNRVFLSFFNIKVSSLFKKFLLLKLRQIYFHFTIHASHQLKGLLYATFARSNYRGRLKQFTGQVVP